MAFWSKMKDLDLGLLLILGVLILFGIAWWLIVAPLGSIYNLLHPMKSWYEKKLSIGFLWWLPKFLVFDDLLKLTAHG